MVLVKAGITVELRVVEGMGHTIYPKIIGEEIGMFIENRASSGEELRDTADDGSVCMDY